VLLIESQVRFFSQLNGRYRYRVVTRITLEGDQAPDDRLQEEFENAALLEFDHERELEALRTVAPRIAERVAVLLDQFFASHAAEATVGSAAPSTPEVIYFVLLDRFANGDPTNDLDVDRNDPHAWHGGDIKGLAAHLDELQALGVTTLWLSPILASRREPFFGHGAFHGYWVSDFATLNPQFGTPEEFRAFKTELDRRGMRLLLDTVLNHVGYGAALLEQHPEYFHNQGRINDWNDPHELTEHDVHGLPDLAQEREPVYEFLRSQSFAWFDFFHPSGFRLDAVKHVPDTFWRRFTHDMRVHAGANFVLLGEIFEGDPAKLAAAQQAGGFSHVLDFPLHYAMKDAFCDAAPVGRLGATLFADRAYPDPNRLVTFLDNHDLPRIRSACHDDISHVQEALTFLLATRGVPALNYGTEVGLTGVTDPENRGDMRFPEPDEPASLALTTTLRHFLAARRAHTALAAGATRLVQAGPNSLVWLRISEAEAALVAINHERAPITVALPALAELTGTDVATQTSTPLQSLTVAPNTVRIVTFVADTQPALAYMARLLSPVPGARLVHFSVQPQNLPKGELYLTGLGTELGNWQPPQASGPLRPEAETLITTLNLPVGGLYEYKLLIKNHTEITYESRPNRYLFVPPGEGELVVTLAWNTTDSEPS